jgi:hypothetical protein
MFDVSKVTMPIDSISTISFLRNNFRHSTDRGRLDILEQNVH